MDEEAINISSHIKKLFEWIDNKQNNILILPLPSFEENDKVK